MVLVQLPLWWKHRSRITTGATAEPSHPRPVCDAMSKVQWCNSEGAVRHILDCEGWNTSVFFGGANLSPGPLVGLFRTMLEVFRFLWSVFSHGVLQIFGGSSSKFSDNANSTPTGHTFFLMHSCCTVILSLTSRTDLTHHAWLKNRGAHCLCLCPKTFTLHRAMSYVTPHLMTPSTGTPSSLILNQSFSEHEPCGDLRPQLSGALAESQTLCSFGAQEAC